MFVHVCMMPDLLTVRDVARRLSISERTVWRWTALGLLPSPVHPHLAAAPCAADIERYLEELSAHVMPGRAWKNAIAWCRRWSGIHPASSFLDRIYTEMPADKPDHPTCYEGEWVCRT